MSVLSRFPRLMRVRPNGCDLLATTALTLGLGCLCAGPAFAQTASGTNATAVGPNATASGDESFAGGHNAAATGRRSVAIGAGAKAQSSTTNQGIINYRDASGVGNRSAGTDGDITTGSNGSSAPPNEPFGSTGAMPSGTAIGENSIVGSSGGVAIGTNNTAGQGIYNSTAIGVDNDAAGSYSAAIGYGNTATGRSTLSFGTNNRAQGDSAIAMGRQSYAIGDFSFAQGFVASAYGTDAVALGSLSVAGESSGTPTKGNIAIGDRSSALGGSAVALGSGASAGNARSVAIGAGSTASRAAGSRNELFSGTALSGANTEFSVGSAGNERQITNVAGGTADTDAVNVRQLRSVGGSLATTIGSSFDPSTGTYSAPTYRYGGTTFNTVPSVIQAIDDFGLRYDRDGSGNPTNSIDLTRGNTIGNRGTVAIRGLSAGTLSASSTDAVNGSQLYATNQAVSANTTNIATNTSNIATNTTGLSDLRRTIVDGTIGLVQQDPTSRAVSVASATDGTQVNFAGTAGNRRLSGLANGVADSDAATLGQLRLSGGALAQGLGGGAAYDPVTGTLTAPSYSVGGKSYGDVGAALAATNGLAVQYVPDANGAATGIIDLTRGGPGGAVALQGVANGRITSGSTDAINGGQLQANAASLAAALGGGATVAADGTLRAPAYTVQGTSYGDVGNALAATDRAVTANAAGIASGATRIGAIESGLNAGTVGLVRRDPADGALTIGAQTDGTTLGLANSRGQSRTITGVAAGGLTAASTDAVNGGQLYTTNQAVSANTTNIATNTSNIATNTTGLSDLRRTIVDGTIGLVQQDPTSRAVSVASATGGTQVNFAGTAGNRRLSGLANGVVDSDAATLGQLRLSGGALAQGLGGGAAYDPVTGTLTAPSYSVGGKSYGDVGAALAATNGLAVQYVPDANGAATGIIDLTRGGPGGAVALQGVANGRIASGSTDAVNGGQLQANAASLASALGGGATVAADGTLRAPAYTVQGTSYGDVGNALAATDRAVTANAAGIASGATRIGAIEGGLNAGTIGLVRRDPADGALTIGAQTDGTTLGLANSRGQSRTITGVAAGGLTAASTDAVNGGQLYATNQAVSANTTNIATNSTGLSDLRRTIGNGTIGLVQQDPTSRTVTVASATDGTQVNFAGTAGNRRLSGLANGVVDSDAATLGQLRLSGGALAQGLGGGAAYDPVTGTLTAPSYSVGGKTYGDVGAALAATNGLAVQYVPDANGAATGRIDLTRGGPGGAVALQGVANGRIASGSTDAVNGGQLNDTNTAVAQLTSAVGSGNLGLVRQDAASRTLTVGAATDGTAVSFANGSGQARVLGGVAAGSVAAGSREAINGGQLRGTAGSVAAALGGGATVAADGTLTAPAYTIQGKTYDSVGTALGATDRAVTANTTAIAGNTADIAKGATKLAALETGLEAGTIGLLRRDPADGTLTIGAQADGTTLKLANKNGQGRTVSGVAAGRLAAASTEAVNGGQLYETNNAVARLTSEVGSGTIGLVRQDPTSRLITIGGATDGGAVSLANASGNARQLTGIADGRVAAGSREAVNGGQLAASAASTAAALGGGATVAADGTLRAPAYAVQGKTYDSVGTALGATDRAVTANTTAIAATGTRLAALTTGVDKGTVGLVRQDQTGRGLTLGAETDGTTLSLSNRNGQGRVVSGVAAGRLTATSTEAVNGAQLNATNQTINSLTQAVTNGTVGLVRQDATGRGLTVGADTDGTTVGFANGTGQARTLTGVADGRIAAGSKEAVNGGQLQAGLAATAAALGGGAKVGADGKLVGPQYTVQGKTYGDVGSALGNLDVAVTNLTNSGSRYVSVKSTGKAAQATGSDSVAVGAGTQASAAGGVALGSGAVADRAGLRGAKEAFSGTSVASTAGAVSVGKAGAERQITNVAGGTADTDAINVRQLKSAGNQLAAALGGGAAFGADGRLTKPSYGVKGKSYDNVGAALGALDTYGVTYDVDPASGGRGQSLTLSGGDPNKPVLIRNVADGITATDAATFGQVTRARAESIAYTDAKALETLNSATSYTDKRIAPLESQMASFGSQLADLNRQVGDVRTEARRGAAIGLAAAALRFDDRPGKLSVAAGGGVWRGESAASFGLGYTLPDGSARVNATGVTAGRDFGIGAGASFTLN